MLASLERARESEQRFVGDASHELRTPLTALRGNAAYIARHGADASVVADLQADAARLSALLDDLLALARDDAAAPVHGAPVDLVELARAAAADDEDAEVVVTRPGVVEAERPALERAVGNLVRNARRHGPPTGRITLTVDGGSISVEDEGPGPRDPDLGAPLAKLTARSPGWSRWDTRPCSVSAGCAGCRRHDRSDERWTRHCPVCPPRPACCPASAGAAGARRARRLAGDGDRRLLARLPGRRRAPASAPAAAVLWA
jgi:hypothetical protein